MNRLIKATLLCAALCALLAGCATAGLIRSSTGRSGLALAERVVKLSDSQNISEVTVTDAGPGSETIWTVANRRIRDAVGPNGELLSVEHGTAFYSRPYVADGRHRLVPRADDGCFEVLHFSSGARFSLRLLPPEAEIYRISGRTVFFRNAIQGETVAAFRGARKGTERHAIRLIAEHGYFRFDARDLATREVIEIGNGAGPKLRSLRSFSYPRTAPASLMTTAPTNICKR